MTLSAPRPADPLLRNPGLHVSACEMGLRARGAGAGRGGQSHTPPPGGAPRRRRGGRGGELAAFHRRLRPAAAVNTFSRPVIHRRLAAGAAARTWARACGGRGSEAAGRGSGPAGGGGLEGPAGTWAPQARPPTFPRPGSPKGSGAIHLQSPPRFLPPAFLTQLFGPIGGPLRDPPEQAGHQQIHRNPNSPRAGGAAPCQPRQAQPSCPWL